MLAGLLMALLLESAPQYVNDFGGQLNCAKIQKLEEACNLLKGIVLRSLIHKGMEKKRVIDLLGPLQGGDGSRGTCLYDSEKYGIIICITLYGKAPNVLEVEYD